MPHAIVFRGDGGIEAQLRRARAIDPDAQVMALEGVHARTEPDAWVLLRLSDLPNIDWVTVVEFEDLRVECAESGAKSATYRERLLKLTELELTLVSALAEAGGRSVPRESLLLRGWGTRTRADNYTKLEAAVSRLRRKLHAGTHLSITINRGVGYRLSSRA